MSAPPEELTKEDKIKLILESKIENCNGLPFKDQRETCLLEYVWNKVSWEDETTVTNEELEICDSITKVKRDNAECYWLFAMKSKNEEICDKITYEPFIDDDYLSKEICHQSLSYEYEDANWELFSGLPPKADPENLDYRGGAKLRGWISEEETFGEIFEYFKVHPDDLIKLPPPISHRSLFQLKNYSIEEGFGPIENDIMAELSKYSESNPATISIEKVYVLMEGAPFMGLKEIITE